MTSRAHRPQADVTQLLLDWREGDSLALEKLMPLVVDELKLMARRYFAGERKDHTLQPTALVNEVYLRLVDVDRVEWRSRAHFLGIAAQLMRCVLVDHARGRLTAKRGGGAPRAVIDLDRILPEGRDRDVVALDDALTDMARINPEGCRIVEMRFFAGLTREEVGEVLGVSETTVKRKWIAARAWLFRQLQAREPEAPE
ncbi:MAG: RNA polymerase subunit sigma-70 [bacterium]|nr:RNA polymerase subunit sigma-70 [bacterium]